MDMNGTGKDFDEFLEARADAAVSGMPNWKTRELSDEYTGTKKRSSGFDAPFLILTLLLLAIGVIMVLSASFAREYFYNGEPTRLFMRQLVFAVSGVAIMLIVSRISVRSMSRGSMVLLFITILLLILVLVIGIKVNGARRWLGIGGSNSILTFQPSEIAKLALILVFAQMTCRFGREQMKTFKYGVLPFISVTAVLVMLVAVETHLSAAIIITLLAVIMMFAGGTRLRWFMLAGLVIIAAAGLLILVFVRPRNSVNDVPDAEISETFDIRTLVKQPQWEESKLGYAMRRINAWLDPEDDPLGAGFQICQSLNAVGSGGLLGQGLGQSRQKYLYLPEEHNDYIFAIVCEELGYIGAILILSLFALLIIRGYWLAAHAKDEFSSLIVTGITSLLAIQVFLNVAVVTNLLPATGISMPLFSSGGTALWIQLVQVGIILSVSRDIPREYTGSEEKEEV